MLSCQDSFFFFFFETSRIECLKDEYFFVSLFSFLLFFSFKRKSRKERKISMAGTYSIVRIDKGRMHKTNLGSRIV